MKILTKWLNFWLSGNNPIFITFADSFTAVIFTILLKVPHEIINLKNVYIFVFFAGVLQIIRVVRFLKHLKEK